MARFTVFLVATLWYFHAVCEGGVHQILYNEQTLTGSCTSTCEELPDRTQKFGCERISNCRFSRKGWTKGFVRCDWCTCDCRVQDNLPQKEVISETDKILTEDDLWGTCKKTCDNAWGLQKTNAFGCSEVRDCHHHHKGWRRGFVRCDYCECRCIIKGYPSSYHLKNVQFNVGLAVVSEGDSDVFVGKSTVENHSNREQTSTKIIETRIATSNMWEKTTSVTLSVGLTTSIEAPLLKIFKAGVSVTREMATTRGYTWGTTTTTTAVHRTEQQVVAGPHCSMDASMVGRTFTADVPYTATLVITYKNGKTKEMPFSGILHQATVSNVHLKYGKCIPLEDKRSFEQPQLDDGLN